MEEKIDVERVFQLLDGDKDVLLINGQAFIFNTFKELVENDLVNKFQAQTHFSNTNMPMSQRLKSINLSSVQIGLDKITWNSNPEGISAELLRIGSKGWEKGKVRIKSSISIEDHVVKVQLYIEFSPDEPPKHESPLDDLRELPEYKEQA